MKISIIIPVYNEETVIKHTVETLKNYLDENFDFYEIIAVNDGSTDKSGEILKNIPYVTFVDFIKNRGKGCAVKKWTYILTDYPGYEDKDCIRLNLLVYKGKVIGGDICSVELDGFMTGLQENK